MRDDERTAASLLGAVCKTSSQCLRQWILLMAKPVQSLRAE